MGLNKYQRGDFTSSTVAFYQKLIFDFLNPFTNISGYLTLSDIFRFIFRKLRITFFFIKLRWQKKIFLQMHTQFCKELSSLAKSSSAVGCQMSVWQHKHLSTRTFQHITKSSPAAGCTRCRLLMSADVSCWCRLRPAADDDFVK